MIHLLLPVLAWSGLAYSSTDVYLSTQNVNIRKQKETAWQHELSISQDAGRKTRVSLNGTYLERFSLFEKRFGGALRFRPSDHLTLEGSYSLGQGSTEILPREQRAVSAYYALAEGLTPYLTYRDHRYSVTRVHMASFGMEIEKIRNIILIPQVMLGSATFRSPTNTEVVNNFGLRAMYYVEREFSAYVFGFRGKEASQGIVGRSNVVVDTRSAGLGGSWFFRDDIRGEIVCDHTDYEQLKNQFLTTTVNLYWTVN